MLSRSICRRLNEKSSRCMATLIATEEFPLTLIATPQPRLKAEFEGFILKNGIRVICKISPNAPITTMKFSISGGSRTETLSQKGAAHMLSVTAFAGTIRHSGLRLCRDLENIGAKFNCTADREKIVYEVKVPTCKAEKAMKVMCEAITYPPAATYVITDQMANAQQYYNTLKKSPQLQITEMLHEAAYGEDSPLGASKYAVTLDKLSVMDIMAYRKANYDVTSMTVSSSGGVPLAQLTDMVKYYLGKFGAKPEEDAPEITADGPSLSMADYSDSLPKSKVLPSSPYAGGDIKVRTDLEGKTYLALAFPIPEGEGAKSVAVLQALLATKVKELDCPKGSLSSFYYPYTTGGIFGFYANGAAQDATRILLSIVSEMKAVAGGKADITASKVKVSLNSSLALDYESPADCLVFASLRNDLPRIFNNFKGVDEQTVVAAAAAALKATPSYAILGTTAGTMSYGAISKIIGSAE